MRKILVLDDDKSTLKMLQHSLSKEFDVVPCETVNQAIQTVKTQTIDLCILDRHLPDGDGIDVCKSIRENENNQSLPIIFLSGMISENDKICCFFSGADDYVTKPFSLLELKARVNARLKTPQNKLTTAELEIDMDCRSVKYKANISSDPINLTPTEFKLLVFLLQHKDRVYNREFLIQKIWGDDFHVSDRVIDTHISHLRKKLSKTSLEFASYRGEGYKLVSGF